MTPSTVDRRQILGVGALAAAAAATASQAAPPSPPTLAPPGFAPKPLPFDPKAVPGLSEKLLVSHFENNYTGAVRRLGSIVGEVSALDPATAPGYRINGLKREELIA